MGAGDNLMGSGMARGAAVRGQRIAFGNGREIIWDHHSAMVFRNNPNVAPPGSERATDLEWLPFYKGHRLYNRREGNRWIWNYEFRAVPGEMFFSDEELEFAAKLAPGFILIEPNVPQFKSVAVNKTWPLDRYQRVAADFMRSGRAVRQFHYPGGQRLMNVPGIKAPSFRHALAALARAAVYVGPEGGLHHGAAAVGIPAVVLFGGFIPPAVTGYAMHANLTGGAAACGSLKRCRHCLEAMKAISVSEVEDACRRYLQPPQRAVG